MSWPEIITRLSLKVLHIKFKYQAEIDGSNYIVDFLLSGKVVIEINGRAHNYIEQIKRDIKRQKYLEEAGYKVINIPAASLICNGFEAEKVISTYLEQVSR